MNGSPLLPLCVGIDAGGTGVRARLTDSSGRAIAQTEVASFPDGGPAPALAALDALCAQADAPLDSIGSVAAGITKITRPGVKDGWELALAAAMPGARIAVLPDFVIAFHGAIPRAPGIAALAGTGSVVYGESTHGDPVRVGGRGWEFGDEGSGTQITAEAIRRTVRALDGLFATSALTDAVVRELGETEVSALVNAARARAETDGRGFLVPMLLARARSGDRDAADLFVGAAGWLARSVRAAHERLGFAPDEIVCVAMAGGLWSAGELLTEPFVHLLARWLPGARVGAPDAGPLDGAVRLALAPQNGRSGGAASGVVHYDFERASRGFQGDEHG